MFAKHSALITRFPTYRNLLICLIALITLGCSSATLRDEVTSGSLEAEVVPSSIVELLSEENQQSLRAATGQARVVPADSEYLVFVIDTSGSMFNNPSWGLMLDRIEETVQLYPNLKGIQILNDMGEYLQYSSRRIWINYTDTNLDSLISNLRLWNPYSNSTPIEGIEEAVTNLTVANENISIYVIGDDLQQSNKSIQETIDDIGLINTDPGSGARIARIHSIAFPTIFAGPERFRQSADDYVALMLELTQQNGGTFQMVEITGISF